MSSPTRFMQLSIAAAIATIALKMLAWWLTGSVGLLSDAMESFVNLAGASFALWMISVARTPADDEHPFGHGKAEYFSSGFEGLLILGAAVAIIFTAVDRLLNPQPLEALDIGLAFSLVSTMINFGVAQTLRRAAVRHRSIALEADARHLMTDVWTSVGVVLGLAAVALTDWLWLDPLIAIAVGLNILREALHLVRGATDGLMDRAIPAEEEQALRQVLDVFADEQVSHANLRTRLAGHQRFAAVDLRVPDDWSVRRAHDMADRIEAAVCERIQGIELVTHVEPNSSSPASGKRAAARASSASAPQE
ncbi:MAG: cation transporter [Zoogloeaceae bacterium]|nr:cation transporter [Zoogloeaceae bacterium]